MPFTAFPNVASVDIGSSSIILLVAKKIPLTATAEEQPAASKSPADAFTLKILAQKIEIFMLGEDTCSIKNASKNSTESKSKIAIENSVKNSTETETETAPNCYKVSNERIENLCEILAKFRGIAHSLGAEIKAAAMTEAVRKAENQNEILRAAEKALFLKNGSDAGTAAGKIRVLSGEEEAELSYKAVSKIYGQGVLSVDVGGGSTELANGKNSLSIPVGALSLYKKMGAIPSPEYKKWSKEVFKEINLKPFAKRETYFVGGTAVALGMLACNIKEFDEKILEGKAIAISDIERIIIHLSNLSRELRNAMPGLENGRGEIIICGLYWIRSLCEKLKIDTIRISTLGLRFGLLL